MADYYFNFPPQISLTPSQRAAVDEVGAISLGGGPGTGKSFVSLWRHIINHSKEEATRSQLLTYTKTLAYYLRMMSAQENEDAGNHVDTVKDWVFNHPANRDEFIIDEAQDVELSTYSKLNEYSKILSYGADDRQSLYSTGSSFNELRRLYPNNKLCILDENFRNSKCILDFSRYAFTSIPILQDEIDSCQEDGFLPTMYITANNPQKQESQIISIINELQQSVTNPDLFNIGILAPFASSSNPYGVTYTAEYYYNLLASRFDCSFYDNMQSFDPMKNIHITTFKSSKGLEFDAVILIGFDSYINSSIRVNNQNDFFVAASRAKRYLFIFSSCNFSNIPNNVINKQLL
nr:3'-5' exonuclease [Bacteroides intestinalis]